MYIKIGSFEIDIPLEAMLILSSVLIGIALILSAK